MQRICSLVILPIGFLWLVSGALAQSPAPHLVSPPNGDTTVTLTPHFKWSGSRSATETLFQLLDRNEELILQEVVRGREDLKLGPGTLKMKTPYHWRVGLLGPVRSDAWSETWSFFTQDNPFAASGPGVPELQSDEDSDGIPDRIETALILTDPFRKTLFVRPKKKIGFDEYEYWDEFAALFPDARPGFADIAPFTNAGIEIVVIGCHPRGGCHPNYPEFDKFDYDPASDENKIPCNIMEVILTLEYNELDRGVFCADLSYAEGHTFFSTLGRTLVDNQVQEAAVWAWDTKGYTPKTQQHDDYFVPVIYPFPLKMYFTEGAYIQIDEQKTPLTQNCMTPPGSCERVSPLNLNDRDGAPNPPYQARPDKTVEFNQIGFDASGGVTFVGRPGKRYKCADVLRRTIAHEMGHALLTADEGDHCENPSCLMYRYTVDWELHDFGGTGGFASGAGWCEHRPGGAQDIRRLNVVHNEIP